MAFSDLWKRLFTKGKTDVTMDEMDTYWMGLLTETSYKNLAISSCVNLLTSILAGCEIKTFEQGKEVQKKLYYLLNVRPNLNQSASVFWKKVISLLLYENEALIVQLGDGYLYSADSFDVEDKVISPRIYKNVAGGTLTLNRSFTCEEVMHLHLNNTNIRKAIDGLYRDFEKLIATSRDSYARRNALRILVEESGHSGLSPEDSKKRKDLYSNKFSAWAKGESAAISVPQGLKVDDWSNSDRVQTTSRDTRALIDDVIDFAAMGFRVPTRLLRGDIADLDRSMDALIMLAVNPLAKIIKDEGNAKLYSQTQYLDRSFMKIDTSRIKTVDIVRYAAAADRLFAAGVNTINDNLRMFDREPLDEDWANTRFVTKNYSRVTTLTEGGETEDETKTGTDS
jgi:HK97 family phage portal protein